MKEDADNENILTKKGYKNTRSRKAVIDALEAAHSLMSAEDIFLRIKEDGGSVNLSTVYRTLELMESKGMVEKTVMDGGKARFGLTGNGHRHQLICVNCHKMISFDSCPLKSLEKDIGRKTQFDITGHRLELFGLCPECKKN